MAGAPLRRVSGACVCLYCQMDWRRTIPEDIAVTFGLRTCALPYARDHEHMDLSKVTSCVSGRANGLSSKATGISSYCIPSTV